MAVCSMQNSLAYRFSYIMNLTSGLITLVSLFYLWKAVFRGRTEMAGFTWQEMQTYLLVTFFLGCLLSWYSEGRISGKILDGSVSLDLLKPLDFQKARFAETVGSLAIEGVVSGIMITGLLGATAGISVPHSPLVWVQFLMSTAASVMVKFGIVYMTGLICFWTTGSFGVVWARIAVTNLLSGALVPLAFLPEWLQKLAEVLPFQAIVHVPASIFLGKYSAPDAAGMIVLQFAWAAVLWMCGKWMWKGAVRQITVHGG
ncbi:antibiotic transporter permease [Cohnella sp. CFH 77786]|nr:antibiotic transporter permease [Cohnella sp. CFH 77786]